MRFVRSLAGAAALGTLVAVGATAAGPTPGGFTSADVAYVTYVPFDIGTATGLTVRGDLAFVTSWRAMSIYDITDVRNPQLLSTTPFGFRFENEDVTGNDELLFFSESLPGDALHIYDIRNPSAPVEVLSIEGAGDHTAQCILDCEWVMGSDGALVYIGGTVDGLGDAYQVMNEDGSEYDWRQQVGLGGNHDVELITQSIVMSTPYSQDFQVLDVSDPLDITVLGLGKHPAPADWVFHSGEWFNEGRDRFILQQGEQNFQPQCGEGNGPIVLFDVEATPFEEDGSYKEGAPEQAEKAHESYTFAEESGDADAAAEAAQGYPLQTRLTDTYAVGNGLYADGSPAVNALGCSAHWFDNQPDFEDGGLVAVGYYEHGTRFLEITPDGRLLERGWFLPYGGSTSAAYWMDQRTVWAVDYARGIDIIEWTGDIVNGNGRVTSSDDGQS